MTIKKNELIKVVNDTLLRTYPYAATGVITLITKANPCVVTIAGHSYSTGDKIWIKDIVGMVELNDQLYTITKINANTFSLDDIDSSGYTAYTSGGIALIQTSLDSQIVSTLKDLSKKDNFLKVATTVETVVGQAEYDLPPNFEDELIVETEAHYPLEYEPISRFRVNLKSVQSGTPYVYTWFRKHFYVRPTPSATITLNLIYASYHPEDCDTILFEDIYREALQERLISRTAQSLNLYDFAKQHDENYIKETKELSKNLQRLILVKEIEDAEIQKLKG